jgi:hypothetical protein
MLLSTPRCAASVVQQQEGRQQSPRAPRAHARVRGGAVPLKTRRDLDVSVLPSCGWPSSRGCFSSASFLSPSSSRASHLYGGCVARASSGGRGGGDNPEESGGDKWRSLCRRVEADVPQDRRVLRRIVRWVGDNPVPALITGVATVCTAGAFASAVALKLALSSLSIVIPAWAPHGTIPQP